MLRDLVEYRPHAAYGLVLVELLEDRSRLVKLGLRVVEHTEVSQRIALVGEHGGPPLGVAVSVSMLQHPLVEPDRLSDVVGLVLRHVHQRVGQIGGLDQRSGCDSGVKYSSASRMLWIATPTRSWSEASVIGIVMYASPRFAFAIANVSGAVIAFTTPSAW